MKASNFLVAYLTIVILCQAVRVSTAEQPPGSAPSTLFARTPVVGVARTHLNERRELTWKLIEIVRASKNELDRDAAIRLLGDLRDPQATQVLVDNVLFEARGGRSTFGPLDKFPAARALIEIGHVVLPEIRARLRHDVAEREIYIFAFVINAVDGRKIGAFRLREALSEPSITVVQRANIEQLLALVEKLDFEGFNAWPK